MIRITAIACILLLNVPNAHIDLSQVAGNIEQYKNKTVTMMLKLKKYDAVFKVVTFYDANNHDISFDCIAIAKEPWFLQQKLHLHPGMEFLVTFTIKDAGNLKEVIADVVYFEPAFLKKLP